MQTSSEFACSLLDMELCSRCVWEFEPAVFSSLMYVSYLVLELEQAPPYLQQEFKIIRDLDQKVQDITSEAQTKTDELLRIAKDLPREERVRRLNEIQRLFQTAEEICNDKVSRAESIYELVDRQIQRLDADMIEFKKSSVLKEMKMRNKTGVSVPSRLASSYTVHHVWRFLSVILNFRMPASAALALALTNNPGDVLDMPIDPNEPTYCTCKQVSYGEMVACDNRDCPIEWFHFGCVGLTAKPRGQWFCPQCSALRNDGK
ncbi:unnamed protein product [Hydatigera taeniaeformis]|uniref:Inhibitor of growth protein n=1 Tax=Hydatigena taeniaeformis TaxID=6205 RepID=A0A0R3X6S7_HYDTA|nr:unnamed protein product [Hydatigera taeniaeformis]